MVVKCESSDVLTNYHTPARQKSHANPNLRYLQLHTDDGATTGRHVWPVQTGSRTTNLDDCYQMCLIKASHLKMF